jgi:uncharacterized protein YdhG (YjbR/CyaY superfamily)
MLCDRRHDIIGRGSQPARAEQVNPYLAPLSSDDQRVALEHLRAEVHRLVPEVTEAISYGLPTFKLRGRSLFAFGGWKEHCSIYPMSGSFLEANADALKGYDRTKGSLHFTPEAPLPDALLADLVRRRVAELEAR